MEGDDTEFGVDSVYSLTERGKVIISLCLKGPAETHIHTHTAAAQEHKCGVVRADTDG